MDRFQEIYFNAADAIAQVGFGSRISPESAASLVDAPVGSKAYYGRMREVKKILRTQYHIFLETVYRGGFEVVVPGNEISLCEGRFLKGYKQMVMGVVHSADIDMSRIQDEQKRSETVEKAQKMAALAGMVKHGMAFANPDALTLPA